jgi:hypothetical protein
MLSKYIVNELQQANTLASTKHSKSRKQRTARRAAVKRRQTRRPTMPPQQKRLPKRPPQQKMLQSQHQLRSRTRTSKEKLLYQTIKMRSSLLRSLQNHSNRKNDPDLSSQATLARAQRVPQPKYRSCIGNRQHASKSWRRRTRTIRALRKTDKRGWPRQRRSSRA